MTSLGVILVTLAVSGLLFLLWLVLEGEQEPNPTVTYGPNDTIQRDPWPDELVAGDPGPIPVRAHR